MKGESQHIHNNLWATTFMGSFGVGLNWNWNEHHNAGTDLDGHSYFENYSNLYNFIKDIDFQNNQFVPGKYSETVNDNDVTELDKDDMIEAYYLSCINEPFVIGWVHNASYYWYNYRDYFYSNCYSYDLYELLDVIENPLNIDYDLNNFVDFRGSDDVNEEPIELFNSTVILENLWSNTPYYVQFYNTRAGSYTGIMQTVTPDIDGKCTVLIPVLDVLGPDIAFILTMNSSKSTLSQFVNPEEQEVINYGKFNIFPNPSSTGIFKLNSEYEENYNLSVFDTRGSEIFDTRIEKGLTSINLSGHPKGVYCMKLENNSQIKMLRIIIN